MGAFWFKTLTHDGFVERGLLDLTFEDHGSAMNYVENTGSVVVGIRKVWKPFAGVMKLLVVGEVGIKAQTLGEMFRDLSTLLGAGVPLSQALAELGKECPSKELKQSLRYLAADISTGQPFHKAMRRQSNFYTDLMANLVEVGEETGKLDITCKRIAEHIDHVEDMKASTKRATLYPLFSGAIIMGAIGFWLFYVIPKLIQIFESIDVEIPEKPRTC